MKLINILENPDIDIEVADQSTMMNVGRQIAQQAAYKNRGRNPKEAAIEGANRAHSMVLMGIDEYFNRKAEKVVK